MSSSWGSPPAGRRRFATSSRCCPRNFPSPATHVNAIDTPSGLKGGFTVQYPDTTQAAGTATCLYVKGNTAFVVTLTGEIWRIDDVSGPPFGVSR